MEKKFFEFEAFFTPQPTAILNRIENLETVVSKFLNPLTLWIVESVGLTWHDCLLFANSVNTDSRYWVPTTDGNILEITFQYIGWVNEPGDDPMFEVFSRVLVCHGGQTSATVIDIIENPNPNGITTDVLVGDFVIPSTTIDNSVQFYDRTIEAQALKQQSAAQMKEQQDFESL